MHRHMMHAADDSCIKKSTECSKEVEPMEDGYLRHGFKLSRCWVLRKGWQSTAMIGGAHW